MKSDESDKVQIVSSEQNGGEEQVYRAGAYGLLATLLLAPPNSETLSRVSDFSRINSGEDRLAAAMSQLGDAARSCEASAAEREFNDLFIEHGV